ncbi:MAG: hypothetical protein HZC52_04420 [Planctomycetes bacterium]|nr:hypothetical protein [Planctomycetota bacterium]
MANVEEARKKVFEAKETVAESQKLLSDLTKRYDDLQESLPQLKNKGGIAEQNETTAYDSHVLGKISAKELEKVKTECQTVKNQYAESSKMLESLGRGIKKIESTLQRLNTEAELSKRQYWESIADEIKGSIPKHVFDAVKTLLVAGVQCCMTRQFILDSLFPNIPTEEFQEIRNELCGKYDLD